MDDTGKAICLEFDDVEMKVSSLRKNGVFFFIGDVLFSKKKMASSYVVPVVVVRWKYETITTGPCPESVKMIQTQMKKGGIHSVDVTTTKELVGFLYLVKICCRLFDIFITKDEIRAMLENNERFLSPSFVAKESKNTTYNVSLLSPVSREVNLALEEPCAAANCEKDGSFFF